MSTLGTAGAVAGGILGGMRMKDAMEKQKLEEERLRQEMEWRREDREYQRGERERAEQERAAGDAYYAKLVATKFMQPGDPGKESIMVPADPNAPDEPTMGVARAEQTPRSEIAKVGMQEAFRDKPVDYRAAARKDAEVLAQSELEAYGLRGVERDRALSALNAKKKSIIDGYTSKYNGDPREDPLGYSKYLTDVLAPFGAANMTPERAMAEYKVAKAYREEAALESLQLLQKGDKEGALKLYCSKGKHCLSDVQLTPEVSKLTGLQSFNAVGIDKSTGKPVQIGNIMDGIAEIQARDKIIEIAMNKQKMDAEAADRASDNTRADKALNESIRHNKSIEGIQSIAAKKAAASSSPAQVQTAEWLVKNKVAKDLTAAWEMVGTSKEKSREAAEQDMAAKLMTDLMYSNKPDKAVADAKRIVDAIRGPQAKPGASGQWNGWGGQQIK